MMHKKIYFYLGCFVLFLAIFNVYVSIVYEESLFGWLWFCSLSLWIFGFALIFRNNFLVSSVLTGTFLINLVWAFDIISFLFTGKLIFGVAQYLVGAEKIRIFTTLYHFAILFLPPFIIFDMEKFQRKSWLGASAIFLLSSIVALFVGSNVINCTKGCRLGVFEAISPINFLVNLGLPYFIVNTLVITIFVFIPTQILFNYITNWVVERD